MAERYERIRIFEETMTLCRDNTKLSKVVEDSVINQKIIWQEDLLYPPVQRFSEPAALILSPQRTLEAAEKYAKQGKKICVLNFASSVTPGGGVIRGASAQEESLCRISTLYAAISNETVQIFYDRHWQMIHRGEMGRENRDDCIFTPGVQVIRKDTYDCALLPECDWYGVDVITCAAPDLRSSDDGSLYRPTKEELKLRLEKRWRRIVSIAAQQKIDVLILGAFGCGVFHNPPELVVQAFEVVYEEYKQCFETIEFAVFAKNKDMPNYKAFLSLQGIQEYGISSTGEDRKTVSKGNAHSWLKLLSLINQFNHKVKEPGWHYEDRQYFYLLKDRMLELLLKTYPTCMELSLFVVPYVQYSRASKDRAGEIMQKDHNQYSFEYYLEQVQPTSDDVELPERASVELQVSCLGEEFCFHMPVDIVKHCGIDPLKLPRKKWIAAPEYHHNLLVEAKPTILSLLDELGS